MFLILVRLLVGWILALGGVAARVAGVAALLALLVAPFGFGPVVAWLDVLLFSAAWFASEKLGGVLAMLSIVVVGGSPGGAGSDG